MKAKPGLILAAVLMAAPVAGGQEARRTDFQNADGQAVESLLLRYGFDAMWALDEQNLLLRDSYRDYYLVTFAEPCQWLDRLEPVRFVPALRGRVYASLAYEARDVNGRICDVTGIRKAPSRDAAEAIAGVKAG